jgi:hypothetical protein
MKLATSSSLLYAFEKIPPRAALVYEQNSSNGESLPQGTSYINLPLSSVRGKEGQYFFEKDVNKNGIITKEVRVYLGDYVIKRAKAYDMSFTTRFQGEWPNTLLAFKRNIFLGSGYGSVSLAVDNNYLRILGETGLLGFLSYFSIFIIAGIYIGKFLPKLESPVGKNFILGFVAGTFGLAINAVLIDVFAASKIAFTYWLLMGIALGILTVNRNEVFDLCKAIKKIITSSWAIIIYLFISVFVMFSSVMGNYFVGDDFTWLRWASDCKDCLSLSTIANYFTNANGFFYRPGTKVFFDLMYSAFWLNQAAYHLVSIFLHFIAVVLVFLLAKKILRSHVLSTGAAFLFLILSGYSEIVVWIACIGHLFNVVFILLSLMMFILWKEKGRVIYLLAFIVFAFASLMFHELGIVAPFLAILYDLVFSERISKNTLSKKITYSLMFLPVVVYALMRVFSQSHWLNGDYSYNLIKLPFNIVGNMFGYFALTFFGPASLNIYEKLRVLSRTHLIFTIPIILILVFVLVKFYRFAISKMETLEKKILIFGFLFFVISLLPFLGLGNIAPRYSYLSSFGLVILFVFFLKKIYYYLLNNGKYIASIIIMLIILVFSSFQLFQLQRIQIDWKEAGEKAKNFLISLEWIYAHYPEQYTKNIYIVNAPIRNGEAWVFPVGLKDASWFVFKGKSVEVNQAQVSEQAFAELGSSFGKVFEYDKNGLLTEMVRNFKGKIVPISEQYK